MAINNISTKVKNKIKMKKYFELQQFFYISSRLPLDFYN